MSLAITESRDSYDPGIPCVYFEGFKDNLTVLGMDYDFAKWQFYSYLRNWQDKLSFISDDRKTHVTITKELVDQVGANIDFCFLWENNFPDSIDTAIKVLLPDKMGYAYFNNGHAEWTYFVDVTKCNLHIGAMRLYDLLTEAGQL